ncbi:MAG: DUF1501 domain-containing protein, partial [Verrucomicrobiota bacterium]|nr:DUF1501 domain-containing protein [Verrucomicrobiota bacterium]
MLSVCGSSSLGRRDFLRVGGLGIGGLTLTDLLKVKAIATEQGIPVKDKAVVFLLNHGGPPQTATIDPKKDAPDGVRSAHGE